MALLPANGYPSGTLRTVGELKAALDNIVAFIRERTGSGGGWVAQAGASTIDLGALTGRAYSITGGPAITSLGTTAPADSFPWLLKMAARTTFTRSANLLIEGLANNGDVLTLDADDIVSVFWEGTNVWRVVVVARASGLPAVVLPGLRNKVINGDFRIDQRNGGNSITITAGAALKYGLDCWYLACTGANATAQRALGSGKNRIQISGASGVTATTVGTRLERANTQDLAGKTASLSVDIQAVGSLTSVDYAVYYANTNDAFGTIASPTRTSITSGSFPVTTTEKRFTVPNIAIPSGATTGIEIVFSTGALGAGNGFYLGDVQFEPGSFCTPFDKRPFRMEVELCQPFFCKGFPLDTVPGSGSTTVASLSSAGGAVYASVAFPVTMRAAPTVTVYNATTGGTGTWRDGGGSDVGIAATATPTGCTFTGSGANASSQIGGSWAAEAPL